MTKKFTVDMSVIVEDEPHADEQDKNMFEHELNEYGVIFNEKIDLLNKLLDEIMKKDTFTEDDIQRYRVYLVENKLLEDDIKKEAAKMKYCKCEVTNDHKIVCEIDDSIADFAPQSFDDAIWLPLVLREINGGYELIVHKIFHGEIDEAKKQIKENIESLKGEKSV